MGDSKRRREIMGDEAYFRGDGQWNDMKMLRNFAQCLRVIGHAATYFFPGGKRRGSL